MYITDKKAQFSTAFVHAVASKAGFNTGSFHVDNDSVDIVISAKKDVGTARKSPYLNVQLKCTEVDDEEGDQLSFWLPLKNYNDLREPNVHIPHILVVLCVPRTPGEWWVEAPDQQVLRRCSALGQRDERESVPASIAALYVRVADRHHAADRHRRRPVKVTIADDAALNTVDPEHFALYLSARGWRQAAEDAAARYWESRSGDVEVLVPRHQTWRDYARLVGSALELVAEVEDRSQLAVLHDIATVSSDVVRVTELGVATDDGTVPVDDAVILIEATKASLLAAACSTIDPRKVYGTKKPATAIEFAESLRLGQTERGSYVLTILSPLPPPPPMKQLGLPHVDTPLAPPPFARAATTMFTVAMSKLVSTTANIMANRDTPSSLEEAAAAGISADLCEAIGRVSQCSSKAEFRVAMAWAPALPQATPTEQVFQLSRPMAEIIGHVGRNLREKAPVEGFQLTGPVVALDRPKQTFHGTATVVASIEGKLRRVTVELFGPDWKKAVRALDKRTIFQCTGELVRAGNFFRLKNPREVAGNVPDPV
jgi:hypothetical protein